MTEGTTRGRRASVVLSALADARRVGLDLAEDLLTHLPDLGDPASQRAVDGWVEQAADTLRAVAEAIEESLLDGDHGPAESARRTDRSTW